MKTLFLLLILLAIVSAVAAAAILIINNSSKPPVTSDIHQNQNQKIGTSSITSSAIDISAIEQKGLNFAVDPLTQNITSLNNFDSDGAKILPLTKTFQTDIETAEQFIKDYGIGGKCVEPRYYSPVVIRWGDGSLIEPTINTDLSFSVEHKYESPNPPPYDLSMTVTNGCFGAYTKHISITP